MHNPKPVTRHFIWPEAGQLLCTPDKALGVALSGLSNVSEISEKKKLDYVSYWALATERKVGFSKINTGYYSVLFQVALQ